VIVWNSDLSNEPICSPAPFCETIPLKGQYDEILDQQFFPLINPPLVTDYRPETFSISISMLQIYSQRIVDFTLWIWPIARLRCVRHSGYSRLCAIDVA
jgi:hypothetical protein